MLSDREIYKQFPEKWAIESCEEVGLWMNENFQKKGVIKEYHKVNFKYLIYPNLRGHVRDIIPDGYELITIEEWRKHYKPSIVSKPEFPKLMLVGNSDDNLEPRWVLWINSDKNDSFPVKAIPKSNSDYFINGKEYGTSIYKFAKEIPPKPQYTIEQAEKEFNIEIIKP